MIQLNKELCVFTCSHVCLRSRKAKELVVRSAIGTTKYELLEECEVVLVYRLNDSTCTCFHTCGCSVF